MFNVCFIRFTTNVLPNFQIKYLTLLKLVFTEKLYFNNDTFNEKLSGYNYYLIASYIKSKLA